jgi:RHS repeat-associated protein
MVKRTQSGTFNTTYFAYDEGINPLLQWESNDSRLSLSHRYLWSDSVDELLADEQFLAGMTAPNTKWALSDHQGTIKDIVDYNPATGVATVDRHRKYDPFGDRRGTALPTDIVFGYTGKYFDEVTGLQNNWNRWYDPKQGRFISQDPIGFAGGDENLYRYVGNGPTNYKDSNGLWGEPVNSTEYGKIDEKGYYIEGGGWDFDGLVLQNGYEVPSNYPGWMFGSFAAYTVWPMLGYRKVGQPAGPSVLNLEASRNAIINHRNQAAAGQTGNSSHHPGVSENELIAIETLVETDLLFYEIGSSLAAASGGFSGPGAFGRVPLPSGKIGTTAPVSGLKNATRLNPNELATGQRLEALLGKTLRESPHRGAEYIDDLGKTYDAFGHPNASKFWNPKEFFRSLDRHLLKSNDFTVIDLTGFDPAHIAAVQKYLAGLSPERLATIIRIGF